MAAVALSVPAFAATTIGLAPGMSDGLACPIANGDSCFGPTLVVDFSGRVMPKRLPSHEPAPVAVRLRGKVATTDGTHPSALREATLDFGRDLVLDAGGLPACHPFSRHRLVGDLRVRCAGAVVGGGRAGFEVAFPEKAPIDVSSKLIVYNGGDSTLYVVALAKPPLPRAIAVPVEIAKMGGSGTRAVVKFPRIAEGGGSLLDFNLRLKRLFAGKGGRASYATAKCRDGQIDTADTFNFRNEAHEPGVPAATTIKGKVAIPCSPE